MAPEVNRPSAVVAAGCSVLCPALGYVYLGKPTLAVVFLVAIYATLAFSGWLGFVFEPAGFTVTVFIILAIWLFTIVHSALVARVAVEQSDQEAKRRVFVSVAWLVVVVVITSLASQNRPQLFGFDTYRVPAGSMQPTIRRGDFIVVDSHAYSDEAPAVNDLVVFDVPGGNVKYIKRIVGLPGDTIEIRDNELFRNGSAVAESFIELSGRSSGMLSELSPVSVPPGRFYVLGDSRLNSRDSRFFGPVERDALHGKVVLRWLAFDDGIDWERFPERLGEKQ